MANKFANAVAAAAEQDDFNEAQAGSFTPLPEGPVRLRFTGYIELGEHEKEYQGKKKKVDMTRWIFEMTGPKIEARDDGEPHRISFDLPKSKSEKSGFYKLFRKMNVSGDHKVPAQMLGEAFRGTLRHDDNGKEGSEKRVYLSLRDTDGAFTISPPYYDDPETGERKTIPVSAPIGELMCFLWAFPDKDQWDSIFIDGEWEARDDKPARSKNIHQIKVKSALNWVGSPMQEQMAGDIDIGEIESTDRDPEAVEASKDAKAATAAAKQKAAADVDPLADDDIPF